MVPVWMDREMGSDAQVESPKRGKTALNCRKLTKRALPPVNTTAPDGK